MKIFKNKKVVIITATVLVVLAVGITVAIAVDKGTTRSGKKVKTAKISSEMKDASSESVYVTEQTEAGEPVAAEMIEVTLLSQMDRIFQQTRLLQEDRTLLQTSQRQEDRAHQPPGMLQAVRVILTAKQEKRNLQVVSQIQQTSHRSSHRSNRHSSPHNNRHSNQRNSLHLRCRSSLNHKRNRCRQGGCTMAARQEME